MRHKRFALLRALYLDESAAQTGRVQQAQRTAKTAEGLALRERARLVEHVHQNAQRLTLTLLRHYRAVEAQVEDAGGEPGLFEPGERPEVARLDLVGETLGPRVEIVLTRAAAAWLAGHLRVRA